MKRLRHRFAAYGALLLGVDALAFLTTNAATVPSFMLITGFLLVWLTLWGVCYGVCAATAFYGVRIRRKKRFSFYMSALLSGVLALQSIGELSMRDILVLLPLAIIGYLYSVYFRASTRNFQG